MEEDIVKQEVSKRKSHKFLKFVAAIVVIVGIIVAIYFITKPKPETYITYVSISTNKDVAYLNLDVKTNTTVTFLKSDFAILTNNIPNEIGGFVTQVLTSVTPNGISSSYVISNSIKVGKDTTILIALNMSPEEWANKTLSYKGQTLIYGNKIKI